MKQSLHMSGRKIPEGNEKQYKTNTKQLFEQNVKYKK